MKAGRFLPVPERPADMQQLWREAERLRPERLPAWLTPEVLADYRLLAAVPMGTLGPSERAAYLAERAELAALGLVIEPSPYEPGVERLYLCRPRSSEIWSIGIAAGRSPFDFDTAVRVLTRDDVTDVPAEFVADPFLLPGAGGWHMFFEVMNWRTGKGEIGHATSSDGCRWNYHGIVLAEPFHLSYPHVFAWKGGVYMMPESFQAGEVRLYRARSLPDCWEFVGPLLKGPYLVDASAFRYHDCWWMFVDASPDQGHDLLRLFGADDLTGPWREHPSSPIVADDPRAARPAGRVLVTADGPVRFAQNCTPAYGTDVRAFIIEELTPAAYHERPAAGGSLFGPAGHGWNAAGMHHVDAHPTSDGWLAAVDGWRMPDPLEDE